MPRSASIKHVGRPDKHAGRLALTSTQDYKADEPSHLLSFGTPPIHPLAKRSTYVVGPGALRALAVIRSPQRALQHPVGGRAGHARPVLVVKIGPVVRSPM
jgi:hypothetical protein